MNPTPLRALLTLTMAVCILALMSCSEENTTSPVRNGDDVTNAGLQKQAAHFLVEYSGNKNRAEAAVRAAGGAVEKVLDPIGVIKATGLTDQEAAALRSKPGIQHVTRDVSIQWLPTSVAATVAPLQAIGAVHTSTQPADAAWYFKQWALPVIHAPEAWAVTTGNNEVRVGVLDTGISPTHIDLQGKYDLMKSINLSPSNPDDPVDYIDRRGHGTWVSGIISTNNITIAGVAPDITMVGVKVLGDNGHAPWANVIDGILYAVDNAECDILNLSLGGRVVKAQNGRLIALLQRTINYARNKGALIICAAGNGRIDLDHDGNEITMPAEAAGAMAISATGQIKGTMPDAVAGYTNYGRSVINIAAPGGNGPLMGAIHTDRIISCFAPARAAALGLPNPDNWYTWGLGTSASAPHVSGAAALVQSKTGNSNPGFIKTRLQNSADDCGAPGVDPYYGKGRLNVGNAVQ